MPIVRYIHGPLRGMTGPMDRIEAENNAATGYVDIIGHDPDPALQPVHAAEESPKLRAPDPAEPAQKRGRGRLPKG